MVLGSADHERHGRVLMGSVAARLFAGALEDVVLRVGALVENHPEIAEMDCNPVTVSRDGAIVVDARSGSRKPRRRSPSPALRD